MTNWEFLTWNSNKYVSYKISSKADNKSDKPTCKFENYWKMELGKVCLLQAGVFPTTQNLKLLFSQNCCIFIEIINISSWDDVIQHCWDLVDWNLLRIVWENRIFNRIKNTMYVWMYIFRQQQQCSYVLYIYYYVYKKFL